MKPSMSHPWRNYANRPQVTQNGDVRIVHKPLQLFLQEITTGWNQAMLPIKYRGRFDNYSLLELPDRVVAIWLITLLRRYVNAKTNTEEELNEI
jgi:hypothetical protein